jgi:WD40 repeat protein
MGFSPDSKSLAVANSQIQILNNDSELSLQSTVAYDWGDMAVAYSPDGSFVVSGGKDGSVVVWNASNGSPQMVLQGVSVPDSSVSSVAVSPEPVSPYGYLIAVSSGSTAGSCCKVSVYSSATGALIQSIPVSGSATFLSPESILVTQGGLSIYSAVTGALTRSINPCLGLGTSAVFPDGHAAAVSCPSNILIVGLANGAVQKTLAESSLISSMAVSPNSLQVAVGLPGSLQIYSVTTGDLERTVTLPVGSQREPPAIAFSRDGRTIADGGGEGLALYFVNVNSGDIVRTWKTETGGVPANEGWDNLTAITYSLDNQFVYYGRGDGTSVMITNPISAPPLALLQSVRGGAVIGGDVLMSRVVVSPAVPAGESVVVHLESSNSSVASVPASVTVPAGAESATFPITTTSVASRQTVSITAYEGKDFQTAEVTVNP